jgi:hypothetical protein
MSIVLEIQRQHQTLDEDLLVVPRALGRHPRYHRVPVHPLRQSTFTVTEGAPSATADTLQLDTELLAE